MSKFSSIVFIELAGFVWFSSVWASVYFQLLKAMNTRKKPKRFFLTLKSSLSFGLPLNF